MRSYQYEKALNLPSGNMHNLLIWVAKRFYTPLWGGGTTQWWVRFPVRFCEVSSELSSLLQEVTTSSTAIAVPLPQRGRLFDLLHCHYR